MRSKKTTGGSNGGNGGSGNGNGEKPRRKHADEFKAEAVRRRRAGEKVAAIAKNLGIRPGLLYTWLDKAKGNVPGRTKKSSGRAKASAAAAKAAAPVKRASSRRKRSVAAQAPAVVSPQTDAPQEPWVILKPDELVTFSVNADGGYTVHSDHLELLLKALRNSNH